MPQKNDDEDFRKRVLAFPSEGIEYALKEAEKYFIETIVTYRQAINRSYALLVVYITTLSICFSHYNEVKCKEIIGTIIAGIIISIVLIIKNIIPSKIYHLGNPPSGLINEYYSQIESAKLEDRLKREQIVHYHKYIKIHMKANRNKMKFLKYSFFLYLLCVILAISILIL